MKTLLLKFMAFVLILAGLAASCNTVVEEEYPKEISFTEYSLSETSCEWTNLPYDEKVIVINSSEELEKYISCAEGSYPAIDFSKNTLLITSGKIENNDIDEIRAKKLKQLSADNYKLNIEIALHYESIYERLFRYRMALLVEKMNPVNLIELNVSLKEPKVILPVQDIDESTVSILSYMARYSFYTILGSRDTCIMINSADEFKQATQPSDLFPEINYEHYTLIIGTSSGSTSYFKVIDQKIIENRDLTLVTQITAVGSTSFAAYWGLYPKLPNKTLHVKYNIRPSSVR